MQSQEGQGALYKSEASQKWREFTPIKSGCGFSKDTRTGESFDPEKGIQMVPGIGACRPLLDAASR